ncbi:MAG: pilus assembly protein, partial [Thiobacillaceae bacterium]
NNYYNNGINIFTGAHRDDFYKWLSNSNVDNDAINLASVLLAVRHAFDHLSLRQAYCDEPSVAEGATNPARSCRDNIHVVITDGETRDPGYNNTIIFEENLSLHEIDSNESLPHLTGSIEFPMLSYTPRPPYMDYPQAAKPNKRECFYPYNGMPGCTSNNNLSYMSEGNNYPSSRTLADLAMAYWLADIVPSLDNDVIPSMPPEVSAPTEGIIWDPKNDPANWQHIVHYFVVTGMGYTLGADWQGDTHHGPHAKGDKNWPAPDLTVTDTHPGRIYDTWHAALNSRGQFYSADRVDELAKSLQDITNRIEKRLAASAAIAANSTRLDTGAQVFQARYIAGEWRGELIATNVSTEGVIGAEKWQATIPAPDDRNIVVHTGSSTQAFDDVALLPTNWATQAGVAGAAAPEVLAWLRGDQTKEQTFDADGNITGGKYRKRNALLGDIVNSDPVFVGYQDYGYASLPEGASDAYKDFVTDNKSRVQMLYVGANDGMLHGFAAGAGTGAAHACGATLGREVFAYIPNSSRQMLPTLANPEYGRPGGVAHRYFVDGPANAGDAFIGGQWRTILIGTTGAGGRTVFALDVTNPCEFGPGKVLWEHDEGWDDDLGYTLAKPIIARLNNGQWAAVFGNGYNSGNGKAVLFLVDLQTGALIKKFDLGGTDNGLSAPSLYDADGNGTTDAIYAGDLEGKLWKFDLSSANPVDWVVAYGGSPLFQAVGPGGDAQPITAAPELGKPSTGVSGVMVYFGTGRFFADGDNTDTKVQSLYGLLDNGTAIAGRSDLVEQSIDAETEIGGSKVRKASANAVSYESKRGWYIDLNFGGAKGERVVSTPDRKFGRIFYTTMVPSTDPCKFGGTSWLMELDPLSGAMPATSSVIDVGGEVIAGIMSTVGIVKRFEFLSGTSTVAVGLGSKGTTEAIRLAAPVVGMSTGRVSWREIID